MQITAERDALKSRDEKLLSILDELQSYLRQAVAQGTPAHEVEYAVWQQLLKLGYEVLQQFFQSLGTGDLGDTVVLPDGRNLKRFEQPRRRPYQTVFGRFHLVRAVYGSREGQKIDFVPLDHRLQLPEGVCSYLLQDWNQGLCVETSFAQAERTLEKMLGIKQSVDTLERMNVQMAQDVADFREDRPRLAPAQEGEVFVSSADGKGIVMRRDPGEKTPAHRSKGQKASRKQMAIVGAVYSIDRNVRSPEDVVAALFDHAKPSTPRPEPQGKQVIASLTLSDAEDAPTGLEATYTWLQEELWKRNRHYPKEMVHLCDGQESLWEARQAHLPQCNTTDILDLLHVTPRIWKAAHVFHREGSAAATAFARERILKVLQGKSNLVVRGLREMGTKHALRGAKQKALAEVCNYLQKNRARMHYDHYLAKGYPIASGVIEGACRHLVKDRMERAGMHWRREGAQAMLNVRSIHVNGDWEAYQRYRIERETRKLYPYPDLVRGAKFPLAA
jgi:hypothetical protein